MYLYIKHLITLKKFTFFTLKKIFMSNEQNFENGFSPGIGTDRPPD